MAALSMPCRSYSGLLSAMSAAIEQLRRLRRLGFRAEPLLNRSGGFDALYLSREHRGIRDAVIVYSATEVLAYRTRSPWNPDRPFDIDPDAVQWRRHGALIHVTNLLLALPASDLTTEPP